MIEVPTLHTERLRLRPFCEADGDAWWRLLRGRDVLRFFPTTELPPIERSAQLVTRVRAHWQEYGYGLWAVELKQGRGLIGRCGLMYLVETDSIEVDFILDRDYWGAGLATEAAEASVRYGFEVLGAEKISGIVHVDNGASQRVLEKMGMRRLRAAEFFGIDCYEYELWRERAGGEGAVDG